MEFRLSMTLYVIVALPYLYSSCLFFFFFGHHWLMWTLLGVVVNIFSTFVLLLNSLWGTLLWNILFRIKSWFLIKSLLQHFVASESLFEQHYHKNHPVHLAIIPFESEVHHVVALNQISQWFIVSNPLVFILL